MANHWTFQTCDFSQVLLSDPATDLVPGGGTPTSDCVVEWAVNDPHSTPPRDRKGFPPATRECRDGDGTCDADGVANGACVIGVSACLNASDGRLAPTKGGCPLTAVTSLEVRPRPDSVDPTEAANAVALRDAVLALGAASVAGDHAEQVVFAAPVGEHDLCTAIVPVLVPLAAPDRAGKRILKFGASATPLPAATKARRDKDKLKLKLVCLPAAAP